MVAGASASRGNGICGSRHDGEEDSSNHGNGGNISICGGGHGGKKPCPRCCGMLMGRFDDNNDGGKDNQRGRPQAMLLGTAAQAQRAHPESRIPNPCNPFPVVGGQGGNQQEDQQLNGYGCIRATTFI